MNEVIYEKKGKVALITLNRPDVRNAFNMAMIDLWHKALEDAKNDEEVRVIVVTGEGKAFCSGGDLPEIQENAAKSAIERKDFLWEGVHKVAFTLQSMDKPVIAAINGAAFGAGLDMALLCDIRLASTKAKLSESYVKVGLVPGNGGTYLLPKLVGLAKAYEMFFTGSVVEAEEAKEIGLVNEVYEPEELMDKAMEMANVIADGPPIQMGMIKRQLLHSVDGNLKDHLDLASSNMSVAMDTEDRKEGFDAFLEKRKPEYKGR
jgi:enoyl-CoA hydratase/carnithine racemase